ncbi:MAG: TonB-dependent receptor domain-containing protein [Cyclobacteriaceae bacterium]
MPFRLLLLFYFFGISFSALAQQGTIRGEVKGPEGQPLLAELFLQEQQRVVSSNDSGQFSFSDIPYGTYHLIIYAPDLQSQTLQIKLQEPQLHMKITLKEFSKELATVVIEGRSDVEKIVRRLNAVEGFGIYEAKKNEVIMLDRLVANKATNNARQVFASVPGLNIWESDEAGLQLDIAARGLSPNRTSNFNTRLNGYDMSADALGYPESYFAPPMQAVERIEIVRGAASLQYGPQFGGMVNFVLKEPPADKKLGLTTEQTVGSYGFLNTFNSLGGTSGKWKYHGYYQYKRSDGWRENTSFDLHSAFAGVGYQASDRLALKLEYTHMNYLTQQAGGLTDALFRQNPRQSLRSRNWFQVRWNLMALLLNYQLSENTKLNMRSFGLLSGREALGNLERINRADDGGNRTLIRDAYRNFGSETRLLHNYKLNDQLAALLVGFRYYQGFTRKQQGDANNGSGPDFDYLNPEDLENSDFDFPSRNYSFFAENIFNLSKRFSLTPGFRWEYIRTMSEGEYKQTITDFAGNIIQRNRFEEETDVARSFLLGGLGLSYKYHEERELYANFSQNFRSVTFSDLRIDNPNFVLDSAITDERGFNIDLGLRGKLGKRLSYDMSLFYLRYNNRIGFLLLADQPPLFLDYRFRTNVGDSRHIGLEAYGQLDATDWIFGNRRNFRATAFSNLSWIRARYVNSQDASIIGNRVEYVPEWMYRGGLRLGWKSLDIVYQASAVGEQFTDATNTGERPGEFVSNAVAGLNPAYFVMDMSASYQWQKWQFSLSVNNVANARYFTRRASSYPGPGIIPATARTFYLSVRFSL